MTHDELLDCVTKSRDYTDIQEPNVRMVEELNALLAVVELHKPEITVLGESTDGSYKETVSVCRKCSAYYPCPTIQVIEKELR